MKKTVDFPDLGLLSTDSGMKLLESSSDGSFTCGVNGVRHIMATGDGKVEFIGYEHQTLSLVNSSMGYPAIYKVKPIQQQGPIKAVLMDLDGTSVYSEAFWVWMIEQTMASMLEDPYFSLDEADLPYVSGHSVSEHLHYCLEKYMPEGSLELARTYYFNHTKTEMALILEGKGKQDAFEPKDGLKPFLLGLKERGIKVGLVTSGLYEKAWPEIVSAFTSLDLGNPMDYYDAIITAGTAVKKGQCGTLGELSPKPHPWLYAEALRVGLGITDTASVLAIEDSGAGICSIRLAGIYPIGISGGNIIESGTKDLCHYYCDSFEEIMTLIDLGGPLNG